MIILAGTKPEHLNMLEGGIIAKLLDEKWTTFAKVLNSISFVHMLQAVFSVLPSSQIKLTKMGIQ